MSDDSRPSPSSRHPTAYHGRLWAITTYFNSAMNPWRRKNFALFRASLGVPLIAVEHGYDGPFELGAEDADIVIQLRGGDPMWQKERLLNLALDALPDGCDAVAWVDCDVIFGRDDWPKLALRALESARLVQLFHRVHYVKESFADGMPNVEDTFLTRSSIPIGIERGFSPIAIFEDGNINRYGRHTCGFAWAAPRAILESEGFYDTCIVGGGDRALAAAALGCIDHVVARHRMTPQHAAQYRDWAGGFESAVGGAIASIDCDLFHLWHGPYEKRQQRERYAKISPFDFDPTTDVALSDSGVWRWNSDKPALHAVVRSHLAARCGLE